MKKLSYIGETDFDYPAYRDENGKLWANINFRYSDKDGLHSLTGNSIEGEPNDPFPANETVVFEGEPDPEEEKYKFQYQMLGRLKYDCEYFLGNGYWYENHLWANNVERQIAKMKEIWNQFPAKLKPEWLSMADIEDYEKKMLCAKKCREKYGEFPHMDWINLKERGILNEDAIDIVKDIGWPDYLSLINWEKEYDVAVHIADNDGIKSITAIISASKKNTKYYLNVYDMVIEGEPIVVLRVKNLVTAKINAENCIKEYLRTQLNIETNRFEDMFPRYFDKKMNDNSEKFPI